MDGLPPGMAGMPGMPGGMPGMGGGMPLDLDNFWDMPFVKQFAFHPRPITPEYMDAQTGPIRDGTFNVSGGDKVSYRFYLPADAEVKAVVYFFHGNAEVCTALDDLAAVFHKCNAALLSVDYRGFSWGTGEPSLTKLCDDAERCFLASQKLLDAAGCGGAKRVVHGRSIGATCAVHLASTYAGKVHGLVVDSGLMSIKMMPMVEMMAPMVFGPQGPQMFQTLPEPFDTVGKLPAVSCPALIMHGDKDDLIPVKQATLCHDKISSKQKMLKRFPTAGHNDVTALYGPQWGEEVTILIGQASDFVDPFPAGCLVEAHSLSTPTFNGMRGRVRGLAEDRVRVEFPEPHGKKDLKPANLTVIAEEDPFPYGTLVEAHSLSSADFNGTRGRVVCMKGDRVLVDFPAPKGEKKLKPDNLKVVSEDAA